MESCVVCMFWSTGCGRPDRPSSCTFRYFIFELSSALHLSEFSCQIVIVVLIRVFHSDLGQAGVRKRCRGSGRPYFLHIRWMWLAQVVELLGHISKMNNSILWTVVIGLLQILWNKPRVRMCSIPSMGSSPKRKCRAGIGELWLSFKKPLRVFLWKISRDFMCVGRIGSAQSPETSTGRQQVLHR